MNQRSWNFATVLCSINGKRKPIQVNDIGCVCTTLDQYRCDCYPSLWKGHKNTLTVSGICFPNNVAISRLTPSDFFKPSTTLIKTVVPGVLCRKNSATGTQHVYSTERCILNERDHVYRHAILHCMVCRRS